MVREFPHILKLRLDQVNERLLLILICHRERPLQDVVCENDSVRRDTEIKSMIHTSKLILHHRHDRVRSVRSEGYNLVNERSPAARLSRDEGFFDHI